MRNTLGMALGSGMARKRVPYDPSLLDPLMAAQAANGFLAQSQQFVQSIPTDPAQAEAIVSLGAIVASVTCLSLSIELFLKSLLIFTERPVHATHDLLDLFHALPQSAKDAVTAEHGRLSADPGEGAVSLRLVYTQDSTLRPPEAGAAHGARDNSATGVLERNRDAFSSWRYLHEIAQRGEYVIVDYEYFHLTAMASAISNCCHSLAFGSGGGGHP